MARLEMLLEKVLHRLEVTEDGATSSQEFAAAPQESPEPGSPIYDNAPALSLFQNDLVSFES